MRLALFVSAFPKGSETFILTQVAGLKEQGADVTVFATRPSDPEVRHPLWVKHEMFRHTVYWGRPAFSKALLGCMLFSIRHPGRVGKLYNYLFRRSIRRQSRKDLLARGWQYLREQRFDAVIAHFGPNGALAGELFAAGILDAPLFTYFHGYDVVKYPRSQGEDPYDLLRDTPGRYLAVSAYWKDRLIDMGFDSYRVSVCRMGVDFADFSYAPQFRTAAETLRLVSVCRLVEKKGIDIALRAVAKAASVNPDIVYTVVGDGPLRKELEDLSRALNISRLVDFVGFRTQPEVKEILDRSHVLVAPSITAQDGDQEGIPVTIMEAMASGLLVISSRHTGIPELVIDGETGFIADEGDVDALAATIERLFREPDCCTGMVRQARARVEAMHDSKKLSGDLIRLVTEYLGSSHGNSPVRDTR